MLHFWWVIISDISELYLGGLFDIFHFFSLSTWHLLWTCWYHILSILLHLHQRSGTIFLLVRSSHGYRKIWHIWSWVLTNIYAKNVYALPHFFSLTLDFIAVKIWGQGRDTLWVCFGSRHYLQKADIIIQAKWQCLWYVDLTTVPIAQKN